MSLAILTDLLHPQQIACGRNCKNRQAMMPRQRDLQASDRCIIRPTIHPFLLRGEVR